MIDKISCVSIIGASGFIGKHLLAALTERRNSEIRVLVHSKDNEIHTQHYVSLIEGDLLKPETLEPLFEPGCTVINLAYLASRSGRDNLNAMANLADVCARKRVKRLIHCSTAVVVGRVSESLIDENTLCNPVSEYEKIKLIIEKILFEKALGEFEISILRPSAVFGPGGQNLLKLANELTSNKPWINYLKSSLFDRRSMNLVCVQNVVAALTFLLDADKSINREIFIISDDDSPFNNYQDIENRLIMQLGMKAYPLPKIPIPHFFLALLLFLAGKSSTNPSVKYSDRKLASFGFKKPQSIENGVEAFAKWYQYKHP